MPPLSLTLPPTPAPPPPLAFPPSRPCIHTPRAQAPEATFTIPQLEFMVGASEKRLLDAVYNHLGNAMFNLSTHISSGQASGAQKEGPCGR